MIEKLNSGVLQECHKKVLKIHILPDITFAPNLIGDYQFSRVGFKGTC